MELTEREILDRISHTKNEMEGFETRARVWEDMWKLDLWKTDLQSAHAEGREEVTLPDPLNTVHLAERLIKTDPDIDCPPMPFADDEDEVKRKTRMRFLTAAWAQNSRQQRKNIIAHAWWMSLVRSRFVWQVKWVENLLPGPLKKKLLPFHISVLDPLKCGFHHGPLYTEWAYYEYEEDIVKLKQMFPDVDFEEDRQQANNDYPGNFSRDEYALTATTRTVTEFWYMWDGYVYSAMLVNKELVQGPNRETRYGQIPLIEVLGDDFPVTNESDRSHSILRPMEDLWIAQCRLVSQIATGQLWHFWPHLAVISDDPVDLEGVGPGSPPQQYAVGTDFQIVAPSPNLPISDRLLTLYETEQQQSSFPPSLYGATTGDLQSGYAAQVLQGAARGRVKKFMENFQMGMETVNEILLCFVDKSRKPIAIWGNDAYTDISGTQYYSIEINKDDVGGFYANRVSIEPDVPQDDIAKDTLSVRLVDSGIASRESARSYMSPDFPEDEQERIYEERAEMAIQEALNMAQAQVVQMAGQIEAQKLQMAAQMEMQQQMGPPVAPPGPGGPPGAPPGPVGRPPETGIVPQSPALMEGQVSQQIEGQLTPEMLGMHPRDYQDLINAPGTTEMLDNINGGPNEGRDTDIRR